MTYGRTHRIKLRLDVTERLEGSYLSSQNRLTWIEVKAVVDVSG